MTTKPQARISSTVGRLQRQPPAKRRHGWSSLSWHAARNCELAHACSMNSNCPSGRSTRAISRSARSGWSTVQRTSVETTVSTDASASGRSSAEASMIRATRACRCRRRVSLRRSRRDSARCSARSRRRSRRRASGPRPGGYFAGGACLRSRPARGTGRTPGRESAATPQTAGSTGVQCWRSVSCRERTSGRMVRASLDAAIFGRWPVPATSQESETRGLRDGGRP